MIKLGSATTRKCDLVDCGEGDMGLGEGVKKHT